MSPSTPLLSLSVDVACGSALCDSEEGRNFLQRRQAFFGKLGFILCFSLYVLVNVASVVAGPKLQARTSL